MRELPDTDRMGVSSIQLGPEHQDMNEVVKRFDQVRRSERPATDLLPLIEVPPCN
jgi:hypothetical protein